MERSQSADSLESRDDLLPGDEGIWQYWDMQESIAEREERDWRNQGRRILKRYRDERSATKRSTHRFNILWSNVQTLKPALYGRMPQPDCERRFKDPDDVGRMAAEILERTLKYCTENYGLDGTLKACVEDMLLPGRGPARVLYVPHFAAKVEKDGDEANEDGANEDVAGDGDEGKTDTKGAGANVESGAEGAPADDVEEAKDAQSPKAEKEVVWEEVHFGYVHWEDYAEGPARQWKEVPWLRYRAFMSRDELTKAFGKEKAKEAILDWVPKGIAGDNEENAPPDAYKKAIVYETWDKAEKEVIWWAPGTPGLVFNHLDDPLGIRGFFPGPDPLLSTTTTDKRVPVPDYHEYSDQADELDVLTARIDRMQRALKVCGIYPGEEKATMQQLVDPANEAVLIPVQEWQGIVDKGGLDGMILWLPVKEIAEALKVLYECRDKAKDVIYEITGLGDILRGATSPEETATAQQLKAHFVTLRLTQRQKDVARFAGDLIKLGADVVGEHFSGRTMSLMSGYPQLKPVADLPPQPQLDPQIQHALQMHAQQVQQETAQQQQAPPAGPPGAPPTPAPSQVPPLPPQVLQAAEQFQQQTQEWQQLQQASQAVQAQNAKLQHQFEAAVQLIKDDVLNNFRVDIEADSTIAADENAEKEARTDFLKEMIPLLEQVIPLSQGQPALSALSKEIVLFAIRSFKAGRTLEEAIAQAFDAIAQMPPKPDKEGAKSNPQAEMAKAQAAGDAVKVEASKVQIDAQKNKDEHEHAMAKLAIEGEREKDRATWERQKNADEHAHAMKKLELERAKAMAEHDLGQAEIQSREAIAQFTIDANNRAKIEAAAIAGAAKQADAATDDGVVQTVMAAVRKELGGIPDLIKAAMPAPAADSAG